MSNPNEQINVRAATDFPSVCLSSSFQIQHFHTRTDIYTLHLFFHSKFSRGSRRVPPLLAKQEPMHLQNCHTDQLINSFAFRFLLLPCESPSKQIHSSLTTAEAEYLKRQ